MAITGRTPLKKWQAAIEVTPGTILPATRMQPMLSGDLAQHLDREMPKEQRGSLIANYGNSYLIKQHVELQGLQSVPTYEDVPWFLQAFAKGGVTASATNVTAYDYVFTPTVATDDLKTVCWEVANDTQTYAVNFAAGTRFQMSGGVSKAASLTVDYVGQKATAQAVTSNLAVRTTEPISLATAKAYIDTTTIGTTQVFNVLDFSFDLPTGMQQFWALDGNIYPRDIYRGATRAASFSATLAFTDTTEYAAFTGNASRKVRIQVTGTAITGSSPTANKTFTFDWYGPWQEAPLAEQNGLVVVKVKGESEYNAAAALDWKITVRNDLATLP